MITLYKKSASGAIQQWSIKIGFLGLEIEYGQVGGAMQEVDVEIVENLSGRTWEEQADLEMESRISKQKDKGYVEDIEKAKKGAFNALGLKKPMLAHKFKDSSILPRVVYLQYKYDGNRCLITKQNGEVFAYTRNGKLIKSIDHILEAAKDIPEGTTLDGELYHHGTPLQTLRSWISKGQAESSKLVYMLYDMMSDLPYSKRVLELDYLNLNSPIIYAETRIIEGNKLELELYTRLDKAIKDGYEGLIVRLPNSPYHDGKRSKSLLKVKSWIDKEFAVESITQTTDGWAMLHMRAGGSKTFKATAPGTHEDKIEAYLNRADYIGKKVTIRYANLTKGGIPFHPIAVAWRNGE
jgi:DNA ligase-1